MRRRILTLVFLLLTAFVMVVASSCGSTGESDATGGSGLRYASYAVQGDPITNWEPGVETHWALVLGNVYETLLRYDGSTNTVKPLLATDYRHSADAKTWTFDIRKGVKFHDGTTLDAEAVKFSIDRYIKLNQGFVFIWAAVESISTPDKYTVVFNLKFAAPLDLIASAQFSAWIVSPTAVRLHGDDWLSKGHEAGTGPYELETWTPQKSVVLKKFPGYWGGWHQNSIDKVAIEGVTEAGTRRQMVESGDAEMATELAANDYRVLEANPKLEVIASPQFQNIYMWLNTKRKPLSDVRVRQALSYAFPYDQAIELAGGGYASRSRGPVPSGLWGHSDQVMQYPYDLEKARALLKQAGYPNGGFNLKIVYWAGNEAERQSSQLLAGELKKLGVTATVTGQPWETQWTAAKGKNPPQDIMLGIWYPTYADPYDFLFNMLCPQTPCLFDLSYWYNKQFVALVDEGYKLATVDQQAAVQKYEQAQQIAMEEAPIILILDQQFVLVKSRSISGYVYNPGYSYTVFFHDLSMK